MRALPLNSTFFVLVLMLVWSLVRGGQSVWEFLSRPAIVAIVLLGTVVTVTFSALAGYINPRDYVQDVVAARQFLKHSTLYPAEMAQMGVVELSAPIAGREELERLPGIRNEFNTLADPPVYQNAHPPVLGIMLAGPVLFLGLRGSFALLFLLSAVLLYASVRAVVRELFPPLSGLQLMVLMGLIFAWYQVGTTLRGGQSSIILLALISAGWLMLRRNRPWMAGAAIGLAACIHVFPAVLILYFAIRCRRAFLAAITTIAALSAVAFEVTVQHTYSQWLSTMDTVSELYIPRAGNLSMAGLISGFSPANAKVIALGMLVTIAAALVFYLWRGADQMDTEYSISVTAMLLASPISWGRYLPIMILPLAVLMRNWGQKRPDWAVPALLAALAFMATPDGTYEWLNSRLAMAMPSFSLVAILLWLRISERQ
ncbi:MAG: glycosyltransferase family 87 protein [Bryobacteraceae bacterium]